VAEALPEQLQDQRCNHRAARHRPETMSDGGDIRCDCAYLCDEGMGRWVASSNYIQPFAINL
jgi:hypothetical protein